MESILDLIKKSLGIIEPMNEREKEAYQKWQIQKVSRRSWEPYESFEDFKKRMGI